MCLDEATFGTPLVTDEEFAMLLIRRANLQEWIALLENERWPGESPEGSIKNVLAAYRKMLQAVDLALQKAPRGFRRREAPAETTGPTSY